MSWLAKLAPFRRGGLAVAEADPDGGINGAAHLKSSGPPLMCLVNDASGRASFKTHTFADAETATDFVLYWFPHQSQGGIISFWAMTDEPSFGLDDLSESTAEPLVMIRDVTRDGVVYLFSFSDIDSAQAFLRDEVRHGTDLSAMMLYWAVPVKMAADPWGKMMLTPSVPPGTEQDAEPQSPISEMWSPPQAAPALEIPRYNQDDEPKDVFEEAPNARTGVAEGMDEGNDSFELTAWMERARKKPARERVSVNDLAPRKASREAQEPKRRTRLEPADFAATPPPPAPVALESTESSETPIAELVDATRAADIPPSVEEEVEVAPVADVARVAEVTPLEETVPVEAVEENESEAEPPAQAEAPHEEREDRMSETTIRVHTNGNGHSKERHPKVEHDSVEMTPESGEILVQENGHPWVEPADAAPDGVSVEATAQAEATQHGENGHVEGVDIRIDIHLESSRAMKVKRWEMKEEPFDGFDSPPGRF